MAAKSSKKAGVRRSLRNRFATPDDKPRLRIITATIGPGKAQLLELIEETGSISSAARQMGMSYLRAWQLAEALNQAFREPLIASDTGGTRGGGSRLTPTGKVVLSLYRKMQDLCMDAIKPDLLRLHRLLKT